MIAQPGHESRIRPNRWFYVAACLPGLLGVAVAVVLAVGAINDAGTLIDSLVTSPIDLNPDGTLTIHASHGDGRTIYEHVASSGAGLSADALVVSCTVRAPDGSEVTVSRASGVSLDQNGANYRSMLRFDTPQDGSYLVSCRQPKGRAPSTPLAVGPPIRITSILSTIGRIVGAVFALLFGIGIAGGLGVLVHQRRERSREQSTDRPVDPLTGMPT